MPVAPLDPGDEETAEHSEDSGSPAEGPPPSSCVVNTGKLTEQHASLVGVESGLSPEVVRSINDAATGPEGSLELELILGVGDLTGDQLPDLVLGYHWGRAHVWRNIDGCTFEPADELLQLDPDVHPTLTLGKGMFLGDLNADGRTDLAVLAFSMDPEEVEGLLLGDRGAEEGTLPSEVVRVFLGTDSGVLVERTRQMNLWGDGGVSDHQCPDGSRSMGQVLSVFDLGVDGRLDLIVGRTEPCPPIAYLAVPDRDGPPGSLIYRRSDTALPAMSTKGGLAILDENAFGVTRTGRMHVLGLTYEPGRPNRYNVGREGNWQPVYGGVFQAYEAVGAVMGTAIGGTSDDGSLSARLTDIERSWLYQLGPDGTAFDVTDAYGASVSHTKFGTRTVGWSTRIVDLDGDGRSELVDVQSMDHITDGDRTHLSVFHRLGDRFVEDQLLPAEQRWVDVDEPTHERSLLVTDLNGDRCPDLVTGPIEYGAQAREPLRMYLNGACSQAQSPWAIRFIDRWGNPAMGTYIRAHYADFSTGHYLSAQGSGRGSDPGHHTAWISRQALVSLEIFWRDGTRQVLPAEVLSDTVEQR